MSASLFLSKAREHGTPMSRGCSDIGNAVAVQPVSSIGREVVRYLEKQRQGDDHFTLSGVTALKRSLQPGDVLLVEGNSHISGIIKYLTQSNWSHAALYVGRIPDAGAPNGDPHVLVEAEVRGVVFLASFEILPV
jgi:hypothetical protein